MTRYALQFGQTQAGLNFVERHTVYGLCPRGDKEVAAVRIGRSAPFEWDLPGGGVEGDEDEGSALIREFLEETGLTVWPTQLLGRAGQYWIHRGEPRNNLATFYEVELTAADSDPSEPDHALVWLNPVEAAMRMRHDSCAWMIMQWWRGRRGVE